MAMPGFYAEQDSTEYARHQRYGVAHLCPQTIHTSDISPDSKIYGANMGPTWGRQDPGGPHIGHMNFAIWVVLLLDMKKTHWCYLGTACIFRDYFVFKG